MLPAYAGAYFEAFRLLQHDREVATELRMVAIEGVPVAQSIQIERPIPFAAIDRYARRYAIEGERFDRLARLIRAMDDEYRMVAAERRAGEIGTSDG